MVLKTIYENTAFKENTEKGHDVSVIVLYNAYDGEYHVESWNPETYEDKPRRNVYYTDCKTDAIETAEFILKRGI